MKRKSSKFGRETGGPEKKRTTEHSRANHYNAVFDDTCVKEIAHIITNLRGTRGYINFFQPFHTIRMRIELNRRQEPSNT